MSKQLQYTGWQVYKRLLGYTKRYKWVLLIGILANIGFALIEVWFVDSIKYLINGLKAEVKDQHFLLVKTPLVIISAILLRGVFNFIATYCMGLTGRKVVQTLREELYEHYLYQPMSFFSKWNPGKLLSTLTYNTEQIAIASSSAITQALRAGGTVVFIIIFMLLNSWKLTLYLLVLIPIIAWVVSISTKRFKKISKNIQGSVGNITQSAEAAIKSQQVIKMFGTVEKEVTAFKVSANRNRQQDMKLIATKGISSPVIQFIAGIGFTAIIYFGSVEILAGKMDGGDFVAFISLMFLILRPLKELTNVNTELQKGVAGAQSVFEILDLPAEVDQGTLELARAQGNVEFKNVSFAYNQQDGNILSDVSFTVKKGQTIALVGRSGSGKTTIASLLQRLFNIEQGQILIDDKPIEELTLASLRQQIATVSQSVILFNDTVANNIAYGQAETVDESLIIAAAKNANAWDFIQKLPEQLATNIGDNGSLLSGGQRQRLAIARAMLKDAPILILDEATSALDTESERHIQDALLELMKDRTTLVVAHRLSTIESADKILVVNEGEVVESGSHQELLALEGEYSRLHKMQFSD